LAKINTIALKRKVTATFELPPDIILDLPTMRMAGNEELVISNHKGIVEYTKEKIRVKTKLGIARILGQKLVIKEINRDDIVVTGRVDAVILKD